MFNLGTYFYLLRQWDDKDLVQADMDRFVDDVEDNVESFLSHDDADPRDAVGRCMDVSKGKQRSLFSCAQPFVLNFLQLIFSAGGF